MTDTRRREGRGYVENVKHDALYVRDEILCVSDAATSTPCHVRVGTDTVAVLGTQLTKEVSAKPSVVVE